MHNVGKVSNFSGMEKMFQAGFEPLIYYIHTIVSERFWVPIGTLTGIRRIPVRATVFFMSKNLLIFPTVQCTTIIQLMKQGSKISFLKLKGA